ncbi:hypothetical protein HYALB_00002597 [Hymenoscyphus albidus]|uniref:Uncharacterized protein n=1 Tax=Hymenoscyphus albidus TaxID=595503 RepID=A0A9N9LWE6_9HELO|nr:hypothetical protein HYALB_00002597 [Hymenoscyphus albidus]
MSSITGLGIRDRAKAKLKKDDAPKSSGSKDSSWLGDKLGDKNPVAGWMGKGKGSSSDERSAPPLHTLRDPSTFAPPPKHVNRYGGTREEGSGAPSTRQEIEYTRREEEEAQREEERNTKPPPVPYRMDTTGLSTSHLPPPPGRRDVSGSREPPAIPGNMPKPPGLPLRLPPRQNSAPAPSSGTREAPREPDSHRGILNQSSLNNLSSAGISVPGFGIGGGRQVLPPPAPPARTQSPATSPTNTPVNNSTINELQSRFSRLSSQPKAEAPSEGTTFAEKQAALRTAASFRKDPSSVSLSDAKTAAGTANNFRERHGEQVKSGWQSASKLNTKYGVADKVGALGAGAGGIRTTEPPPPMAPETQNEGVGPPAGIAKKKPPPPPPKKKVGLAGSPVAASPQEGAPPPIPLSSKPRPPVSGHY